MFLNSKWLYKNNKIGVSYEECNQLVQRQQQIHAHAAWYHTELLACGVAGSMEFKYWQLRAHGGSADPIDFILTVAGVNIGYLLLRYNLKYSIL